MKTTELMNEFSSIVKEIESRVANLTVKYWEQSNFTGSNEEVIRQADQAANMLMLHAGQTIRKRGDAWIDEAKAALDVNLAEAGKPYDVEPGTLQKLDEAGVLQYWKRRNQYGTSTTVKDFKTELRKLGVGLDTLNKAEVAATKPRRGNTYYEVHFYDSSD